MKIKTEELILLLSDIAEDANCASGCSHEDALQCSLKNIASDLEELIDKLSSED